MRIEWVRVDALSLSFCPRDTPCAVSCCRCNWDDAGDIRLLCSSRSSVVVVADDSSSSRGFIVRRRESHREQKWPFENSHSAHGSTYDSCNPLSAEIFQDLFLNLYIIADRGSGEFWSPPTISIPMLTLILILTLTLGLFRILALLASTRSCRSIRGSQYICAKDEISSWIE